MILLAKTESGVLRSAPSESGSVISAFKGIPFAASTAENMRWKEPAPYDQWYGVRNADQFGPACPQASSQHTSTITSQSEDCLYLNIWTPAHTKEDNLPVMFWIHGGAFIGGSGSEPIYRGDHLAKLGVVVVTINYRLGALGFMVHRLLSRESRQGASGNYGLMDQIAGLNWVKKNIREFGGDPSNVTVFGESAGSLSISILMTSPLTKGLFHKAILESGAPLTNRYIAPDFTGRLKQALKTGDEITAKLGCDKEPDILEALRSKTPHELIDAAGIDTEDLFKTLNMGPVYDGWIIPDDPVISFKETTQHNIPVIVGSNLDEGTIFLKDMTVEDYKGWVNKLFGENSPEILKRFPVKKDEDTSSAANRLLTIAGFAHPARVIAKSVDRAGNKAYLYQFTWIPMTEEGKKLGAHHGVEIDYVFGTLKDEKTSGYKDIDFKLSNAVMMYWTNFAKTGNPNSDELPFWPSYNSEKDLHLELGYEIKVETGLYKDTCDFLDEINQ
ncbi:MAG: carboxylesterase/lipase family protein [Armatimonadota bacterium]